MERFLRTELLLGKQTLERFKKSKVTLLGLGAVGSYCLEALARAGIGDFRLADFDIVRPSNINRNLLAFEQTLGREKTEVAAERVLSINPDCKVETLPILVNKNNIAPVADGSNIVIDAVDSLGPKTEIISYLVLNKIPFLSSMGAALRCDPLAVRAGDISQAACPLAQRLRKRLKKHGITDGVTCVYSEEKAQRIEKYSAIAEDEIFKRGRIRTPLGSMPTVPAAFGITLASLALSILTKD
jgi:tRNA A37 threonylcarbamoyladenosine dehydratase